MPQNSDRFPKRISERFLFSFSILQDGLYAIAITARCRSGKQTGVRSGEDLRVEIDSRKFREVPEADKPQYQDIPAAWNGTRLQGLEKTIIFLLRLNAGEHQIAFIPDKGAVVENEPEIKQVQANQIIFNFEDQAEDGDRRPWYTIALIDLPLINLSADITVKWRWPDSDDVKLITDGRIKKNPFSVLHRYWLWSGSILKKLFGQERQQKTLEANLDKGIHYIEFWADRTPVLHRVNIDIGQVVPKAVPTADNPKWTGDFDDDPEDILLARLVLGEAEGQPKEAKVGVAFSVINRVRKQRPHWGLTVRDVILKEGQYDGLWNKNTREKARDPFRQ